MHVERQAITVTTAAANGLMYSGNVTGHVAIIRYVKGDFDNGSTITITGEATGVNLWTEVGVNASETMMPVAAPQLASGADSTISEVRIPLANERISIAVTAGGAAKSGVFHITVEGNIAGDPAAA